VREMISEVLADEDDGLSNAELEALAELQRGMVRASFGIYTTVEDIDALADAVQNIAENRDFYEAAYTQQANGDYMHNTFIFDHARVFSVRGEVDAWLAA
jgi:cysteine desulfurase/selenocysteine lyase